MKKRSRMMRRKFLLAAIEQDLTMNKKKPKYTFGSVSRRVIRKDAAPLPAVGAPKYTGLELPLAKKLRI